MLRTARWVTGSAMRDLVLFALVWVWMVQLLLPFGEATKIPSISPFLLYLGVLFVVDFLIGNFFGRVALKLILLGAFMFYNYYTQYSIVNPTWLIHWFTDLYFSAQLLLRSSNIQLLPDSAYTTVFLIVLWLFQSMFRQSLRSRAWMVIFLILGATGLGVLDTFYVSDDKTQIVLFVLLGLIILAFMQLPVIERIARMPQRMTGWPREWLTWTLVLSLIVVGVSWAAPKKTEASWPDPVAYLNSKVGNGTGQVHQKIGYGNDDAHLGGPFEMDDTPVFSVLTDTEGYYRGESKPVYTGTGWLSSSLGEPVGNLMDFNSMEQHELQTGTDSKKIVQTFSFQQNMFPVVFSEYRMTGVEGVTNSAETVRYSDLDTRLSIGQLSKGTSYTVTAQVPIYDEKKLKNASMPAPDAGFAMYTQLPDTLPQRVRALAVQIVQQADAKTPYERASALESYLRNHYTYDTKNVPIPTQGQDFVDQFLFDSKRGYCDHFSSAFAVMARSLGMPTRWVKGFTKGDVDMSYHSDQKDTYKYVVRARNAHSWPEVYFEGVGWVPFEPTATFTSAPRIMKQETDTSVSVPPVPVPTKKKNTAVNPDDQQSTTTTSFVINWQAVGISAGIVLVIALLVAFLYRRKLLTWYYIRRAYKRDEDALTALNRLITIMEKLGWRRTADMTLREYAYHLSSSVELRGREMIPLTKVFERVRYGQQEVSDNEKSQIRDLWTRIIRKAGRFRGK
jgi:transglutaminase-like putative cysteine protease